MNKDIKLQILLSEILPSKEELIKFKILMENQEDLVDTPETEDNLKAYREFMINCQELDFDGESLYDVVVVSESLKFAKDNIELTESDEESDEENGEIKD